MAGMIGRRGVLAGLAALLAGGAALMLPGCVPTEMSGNKGNAEASIYYASQAEADAALAAFDRDNPQCQLWTNWQRACSRLQRDGQKIHCNDTSVKVSTGQPFCVAQDGENYLGDMLMPRENVSPEWSRFCDGPVQSEHCMTRSPDRPFNGRRIQELRHPFCEEWSSDAGPYCSETETSAGISRCDEIKSEAPSLLQCSKLNSKLMAANMCTRTSVLREGTELKDPGKIGQIYFPVLYYASEPPINVIFCNNWKPR